MTTTTAAPNADGVGVPPAPDTGCASAGNSGMYETTLIPTPLREVSVVDPPSATAALKHRRIIIPTQSGKWILGKTIGAGSMGKVKLARMENGTEQVACKIIPRASTDDHYHSNRADKERADLSKEIRTAREAAIVTLLSHPHICGLRDVIRTNHHWYMLFEFVNGGQMLDYIISHGKLKDKQARKFSRQIASALDYCHRNSIVHRDLKIENILISKTGDIKIIDFGLSNLFAPRGYLKTFCGSLYFAAPELLQARAYTGPEVDVWSFGIVLYVLVCGKVPFDDQSMPALHAKIKRGVVDYPNWLTVDCRHLLSRMLVTDPKQRATMHEVMAHPWMVKGYNGAPDNFLPEREPLTLPLDQEVINSMTGFNFGPPDTIKAQLIKTIDSEEYVRAVRLYQKERDMLQPARDIEKRRMLGFDFYKRRSSSNSRDNLTTPSTEALQLGSDPLNAFSPLISIYYLVREKQERDRLDMPPPPPSPSPQTPRYEATPNATATANQSAGVSGGGGGGGGGVVGSVGMDGVRGQGNIAMAPAAAAARTDLVSAPTNTEANTLAYDDSGEGATGGRARPRDRTQEDLAAAGPTATATAAHAAVDMPDPVLASPSVLQQPLEARADAAPKREGGAAGLLRRLSTRMKATDKDRSHPPLVHVQIPGDVSTAPRKSFSIRRGRRERDDDELGSGSRVRSGSSQPRPSDHLLSPPLPSSTSRAQGLGRSTSVNSADMRRRVGPQGLAIREAPPTSGSDRSTSAVAGAVETDANSGDRIIQQQPQPQQQLPQQQSRSVSMRAKTLAHARRESIQLRRQRREEAREAANLPEEVEREREREQSRARDQGQGHNHGQEQDHEPSTTDHEADVDQAEQSGVSTDRLGDEELAKPVFLKGLFSVSTTSPKSVPEIRAEIRRVLKQLDVEYTQIKGGFSCRHAPSIDLDKVVDPPTSPAPTPGHRRRFSFGALRSAANDRDRDEARADADARYPSTPRTNTKQYAPPRDRTGRDSNSSVESVPAAAGGDDSYNYRRAGGETTTHVQSDLGGSMVVEFEIFIVKVPLFSLHGIQFKRMMGNTWQFKSMADHILRELRL